jgi:GTP-binding protein of the ras superfamily involved in termination of M-phase
MEKTISLRDTEITFSIWDLGGQKEFLSMLPLVCNDAVAIFFMFDLTRKATLLSVKEWYRQARLLNRVRRSSFALVNVIQYSYFSLLSLKTAQAFLVGTKFDIFSSSPPEEVEEMDKLARKYSKAMKAPLIFSSASHSINVQKIFKIVLARVFDLKSTVQEITSLGEPLLIFK